MKIALIGNGKMGQEIINLSKEQIVVVIENFKYNYLNKDLDIDVIIDFSNRENLKYIYDFIKSKKVKVVIGTTNYNEEDLKLINEMSKITAVMFDSNYSKGITIIKKLLNENINLIKNFDISIIEKHHKNKIDIPSGTAKSIGDILKDNKINHSISSIRGGMINGEHEIDIFLEYENIEIKHISLSRKVYALGALEAARWIMCKENGLYNYACCLFD